mgnify:CR=1 FL=1
MFDFSKRLEDFSTGKPTGGRGARGKYNRDERAPRSGGASGGAGGERRGFGPGHAPSRDGERNERPALGGERKSYGAPARGGFGGERKSFGAGAAGRTSYSGGS